MVDWLGLGFMYLLNLPNQPPVTRVLQENYWFIGHKWRTAEAFLNEKAFPMPAVSCNASQKVQRRPKTYVNPSLCKPLLAPPAAEQALEAL